MHGLFKSRLFPERHHTSVIQAINTNWSPRASVSSPAMQGRRVVLQGRPPLSYDVLSINVGITPSALLVPGAQEHATAVKPIDRSFRNNLCHN